MNTFIAPDGSCKRREEGVCQILFKLDTNTIDQMSCLQRQYSTAAVYNVKIKLENLTGK